jgi:hypothetical protein
MADVHVQIEVTSGENRLPKAIAAMREFDPDFPSWSAGERWWHKPPTNARAILARCLSRHGMSGRLSVVEHQDGTAWDAIPNPVWTGFSARSG